MTLTEPTNNTGSIWDENHRFPIVDWQYEVANGDTMLGYQQWCKNMIEIEKNEGENNGQTI